MKAHERLPKRQAPSRRVQFAKCRHNRKARRKNEESRSRRAGKKTRPREKLTNPAGARATLPITQCAPYPLAR
jgi:hypothetical protein